MKRLLILILFIFAFVSFAPAQTQLSQTSHKQGAENSVSITSNAGAQTGIDVTGYSTLNITISGTYGSVAFKAEGSTDGTNYTHTPLPMFRISDGQKVTSSGTLSNTIEQYVVQSTGFKKIRVNVTAYTSGTAVITQTPIAAPFTPAVIVSQPTAGNLNATVTISGTPSVNAAQSGTWTVQPGNTANTTPWLFQIRDAAGNSRGANVNASNQLSVSVDNTAAVNQTQVGGNSISTGNGTAGTGVQRQTVASDNSAIANWGQGATGSAVPSGATYAGAVSGGNLTGIIQGDTTVKIDVNTNTTTQLVALSSGKKIYVTNFSVISGGTGNIKFVYGTGSNCGTGTTDITGSYNLVANTGLTGGGGLGPVLVIPASQALCITTSAAVQYSGHVTYTQF